MIKTLSKDDHQGVIEICENIYQQIENKSFFNWNSQNLTEEFKKSEGLVFIEGVKVMAFILYRTRPDFDEIMVLGAHPKNFRLGIMSSLLKKLQESAAQQKKSILLEVHHENHKAIQLYSKFNFKKINLRARYYQDCGDALILSWSAQVDQN